MKLVFLIQFGESCIFLNWLSGALVGVGGFRFHWSLTPGRPGGGAGGGAGAGVRRLGMQGAAQDRARTQVLPQAQKWHGLLGRLPLRSGILFFIICIS